MIRRIGRSGDQLFQRHERQFPGEFAGYDLILHSAECPCNAYPCMLIIFSQNVHKLLDVQVCAGLSTRLQEYKSESKQLEELLISEVNCLIEFFQIRIMRSFIYLIKLYLLVKWVKERKMPVL